MDYATYLQSDHWKRLSAEARRLAGERCQVCNSPDHLDVHHNNYQRVGDELPTDVICLCHNCHEKFHFEDVEFTDEPLPPVIIFHGKSDSAWGTA